MFSGGVSDPTTVIRFSGEGSASPDGLRVFHYAGGFQFDLTSTAQYRDPSAWYHIVVAFDTTQATSTDRLKIYVNGVQVTAFDTATYPSLNYDTSISNTVAQNLCRSGSGSNYFNGYMTEVNFIDGQQLTSSSFGETDASTGVWKPKKYIGTYGTNGFYLNFSDNSNTTAATLGKDSSSNGNNWTPNNFSVTAGIGNDSLVDTPTNYGTDTGVGGSVRGNYATLNALAIPSGLNLANGNLAFANTGNTNRTAFSTVAMTSGKWYCEVKYSTITTDVVAGVVYDDGDLSAVSYVGNRANGYGYEDTGNKYNNGSATAYGASWTTANTIGIALDLDAGTVVFYKDGVSQGTAFSSLPSGKTWFFAFNSYGNTTGGDVNFGQRAFAYTAPSGFKALCTQNLPTPAVVQGDDYFNTVLWTGNGASSRSITGVGFQPDFVWIKSRSTVTSHALFDQIRGAQKWLGSNSASVEQTYAGTLDAFGSDGFTVGSDAWANGGSTTYAAWNWKANGAGSSNTAGSISSTVSASTTAGFSIVTYASGAAGQKTVGHGLGVAPSMIITKSRDSATFNWGVYHRSVTDTTSKFLRLNTTDAVVTFSTVWGAALPTSTVFGITSNGGVVENTNCIAYCFAEVAGYSAFGSYTGNGSADGPFVYTGFRPRYILTKVSSTTGSWLIHDTVRDPYNVSNLELQADTSLAEYNTNTAGAGDRFDILSNGFKNRSSNSGANASGATYIYAAFAENPFKFSLAR
jgi:hypothetical protein